MSARFSIKQTNPLPYRKTIIELWHQYLPGTPASRFDWLYSQNVIWLFAFSSKSNDFAGCISILPRLFFCNGTQYRCGILGDFIIPKRYRVFGPARMLPQHAAQNHLNLGFDYIYTVPNKASQKTAESVGFSEYKQIERLVRPIDMHHFISKYAANLSTSRVVCLLNRLYQKLCFNWSNISRYSFSYMEPDSTDYQTLWETVIVDSNLIVGDRSIAHFKWKFVNNPTQSYRFISVSENNQLRGVLIYHHHKKNLYVDDIICSHRYETFLLLSKLINEGKKSGATAITYETIRSGRHPFFLYLLGFIGTDDRLPIMVYPNLKPQTANLIFNPSDRNI